MATMTMIENGDMAIAWECSACAQTIADCEDFEKKSVCPLCDVQIDEFIGLYEEGSDD